MGYHQQKNGALQHQRAGEIKGLLLRDDVQKGIASVCAKHMSPERLTRMALRVVLGDQKLLQCSTASLLRCFMTSAVLGLEPDPTLGLCSYVPFGGEATFMLQWKGKIDLAMRSGLVANVTANPVHEQDEFEFEYGLEQKLRHVPYMGDGDPGPVKAAYCVFTMKDGTKVWHVCPKHEIERHRERSRNPRGKNKAGEYVAWDEKGAYPEMARKTAVHVTSHFVKLSPEYALAQHLDEAAERGEPQSFDLPESVTGLLQGDVVEMVQSQPAPDQDRGYGAGNTEDEEPDRDLESRYLSMLAERGAPADDITDAFLDRAAASNQMSVDQTMQYALDNPDKYIELLHRYRERQKQKEDLKNWAPAATQTNEEIVEEFARLKTSGLWKWAHQNKGRINGFSDAVKVSLDQKWQKVIGKPFPWTEFQADPPQGTALPHEEPQEQPRGDTSGEPRPQEGGGEDAPTGGTEASCEVIACPDGGEVDGSYCQEHCEDRQGCPSWE